MLLIRLLKGWPMEGMRQLDAPVCALAVGNIGQASFLFRTVQRMVAEEGIIVLEVCVDDGWIVPVSFSLDNVWPVQLLFSWIGEVDRT